MIPKTPPSGGRQNRRRARATAPGGFGDAGAGDDAGPGTRENNSIRKPMTDSLAQLESRVLTEGSTNQLQSKIDAAMRFCHEHPRVLKAIADHGVDAARRMHGEFVDHLIQKLAVATWMQHKVNIHIQARELIHECHAAGFDPYAPGSDDDIDDDDGDTGVAAV